MANAAKPEDAQTGTADGSQVPTPSPAAQRRRDDRHPVRVRAATATIDPVHDLARNQSCYQTSIDDHVLNISRRGLGLITAQPPNVGTRLWVELDFESEERPVELVGRACWTRVDYEPGRSGARPVCAVGIELLGGSPTALDRFDRCLAELREGDTLVAAPRALG